MPAEIIVRQKGFESRYWIEKEVLRIGGSSDSDLVIINGPQQILTVQYRNGQYLVFNRMRQPIQVHKNHLAPGAASPWGPRQRITAGEGLDLVLAIEGNGKPSKKPRMSRVAHDEVEETDPKAKSNKNGLLGVILGGCVLLIGFMLFNPPTNSLPNDATTYQEMCDGLSRFDDAALLELRFYLQEAQECKLRGDRQGAASNYIHLRDLLMKRQFEKSNTRELERRLLLYAAHQLNHLRFDLPG